MESPCTRLAVNKLVMSPVDQPAWEIPRRLNIQYFDNPGTLFGTVESTCLCFDSWSILSDLPLWMPMTTIWNHLHGIPLDSDAPLRYMSKTGLAPDGSSDL